MGDDISRLMDGELDQETFDRQLQDILKALEANLGVRLAPSIGEGMRVRRVIRLWLAPAT